MMFAVFLFEVEWLKLGLMMGGILLVTAVLVGGGGYLFLRVFASLLNSRRDSWESSAATLGLSVDRTAGTIYKPFKGKRNGRSVTVSHFAVMRGEHSSDDYAAVEVGISRSLPFIFVIEKPEMLYQKISDSLFASDAPETGHDIFDRVFRVKSSNIPALNHILHKEMMDGQSPTVLNDLLLAAKRFHRVKISDRSVTLGVRADFGHSDEIETGVGRAIYLAERIEAAAALTEGD